MTYDRPLRVLLFSPVAGRDPLSGDTSYTQALLDDPPPGVKYTGYAEALGAGTLQVRGRRPRHGALSLTDVGLLAVRGAESALRRGVMFREPTWFVTVDESAFELVHLHLFPMRQIGSAVPVVSSAGYPLPILYGNREGWSPRRLGVATALERSWASWLDVHNPWLRPAGDGLMSVYTEAFREWMVTGGVNRDAVRIVGTGLGKIDIPEPRSDGSTLGFVGRDFIQKGGDVAVESFRRLRRVRPGLRLIVVTSTGAVPEGLNSEPGVKVHTDVPRDQVLTEVLPRIDVLLAPTISDCGVPYGVLDALQASTPVVTSRLRWLDDRLTGPGVRRVAHDPEQVAKAASELLDPAVLPTAAASAHELWAREFSMEALNRDLRGLYDARTSPVLVSGDDAPSDPWRRLRVLVAARPYDLSDATTDGFVDRHLAMADYLSGEFDLGILTLRPDWDDAVVVERFADRLVGDVAIPRNGGSRARRLLHVARLITGEQPAEWERRLADAARAFGPDVVVTVGPWLDYEYRTLFDSYRSVHLFEEDLSRMPELAPQSVQAQLMRRLEDLGRRRAGMRPDTVVVIAEPELEAAKRRFGAERNVLVPFTLDPAQWPIAAGPSDGEDIAVLGNLAQERNTEGLVAFLRELCQRRSTASPNVRLVSGAGFHPDLGPFITEPWVTAIEASDDPYGEFRRAAVTVVASTRATGFKTTILQAWTVGCPVVCFEAAAATLGARGRDAVVVAGSPSDAVDKALKLIADHDRRIRIAERGLDLAASSYQRRRADGQLIRTLRLLAPDPVDY